MPTRQIDGSESPSCAVLVLSCDRYRDLWAPFFTLFHRHWPDPGMPVYLGTDTGVLDLDWVHTLNAGNTKGWSKRLRFFLQSINTDYVLLLLEDFFFDSAVSTSHVAAQTSRLHSLKGVSLRLFPNPPADYFRHDLGVIHTGARFRVSLQAAIWNRVELLKLLVDDESPWEFERHGTRRSRTLSGFYCVPKALIHYRHVVERGEWFRSAAEFYASQNIGCNFAARPVMHLAKTCKKVPLNLTRRFLNRLHSRWLCLRYPEAIAHDL